MQSISTLSAELVINKNAIAALRLILNEGSHKNAECINSCLNCLIKLFVENMQMLAQLLLN